MEKLICANCGKGKLIKKVVPYAVYGVKLGDFPALVCASCNEVWFDEATAEKIEKLEKEKNLFGLSIQTKISYSGNSLIIRIPKAIADFFKLKKEETVTIHPESKNKIAIEV